MYEDDEPAIDIEGGSDTANVSEPSQDTDSAMQSVQDAFAYSRQRHGLEGGGEGASEAGRAGDRINSVAPTNNARRSLGGPRPSVRPHPGDDFLAGEPESPNVEDRRNDRSMFRAGPSPARSFIDNWSKILGRKGPDYFDEGKDTGNLRQQTGQPLMSFADGGPVEEYEEDAAPAVDIESEAPAQQQEEIVPQGQGGYYPDQGQGDYGLRRGMEFPDQGPQTNLADRIGHTMPRFATTAYNKASAGGDGPVSGPLRRFMAYLSGADASDPEQVSALEQQVDPEGILDEGTRKMLAVQAATKSGGPEAAAGAAQHYRKKYDAYRGFAAAALAAGDVAGAAKSASQAYPNLLDGSNLQFTPAPMGAGVVATLSGRGGQSQTLNLTPAQFNEFLVGPPGDYETVMEVGIDKLINSLAQKPGTPPSGQGAEGTALGAAAQGTVPQTQAEPGRDLMQGTGEGQAGNPNWPLQDKGGGQGTRSQNKGRGQPREPEAYTPDPRLLSQAKRLFPSPGPEREAWIAQQEQQAERNDIDRIRATDRSTAAEVRGVHGENIATTKVAGAQGVADTNKAGRVEAAQIRAQVASAKIDADTKMKLAQIAATTKNAALRNAVRILEQQEKNVTLGEKRSPEGIKALQQIYNLAAQEAQGGAAPAPQQQNAPAPQQQNAPAPGGQPRTMIHPRTKEKYQQTETGGWVKVP